MKFATIRLRRRNIWLLTCDSIIQISCRNQNSAKAALHRKIQTVLTKLLIRLRHVTEKRQLRNSKLVTTGFRGSKSAITLLSGDDRTRRLQPVTVRRLFSVSTEILEHPSKQQDGETMLSWMVNMGVGYPKTGTMSIKCPFLL